MFKGWGLGFKGLGFRVCFAEGAFPNMHLCPSGLGFFGRAAGFLQARVGPPPKALVPEGFRV